MNLHIGEVRETYGFWQEVPAPLPESMAWYHPQYLLSPAPPGVNSFLRQGTQKYEYGRRASWGFTLPRLIQKFGNTHMFETIYELFLTLPIMVSKKKHGSRRVAW